MKCIELLRILAKDKWYPVAHLGSHIKLKHKTKIGTIIFPNHGSQEVGKGLAMKLLKDAEIKSKRLK